MTNSTAIGGSQIIDVLNYFNQTSINVTTDMDYSAYSGDWDGYQIEQNNNTINTTTAADQRMARKSEFGMDEILLIVYIGVPSLLILVLSFGLVYFCKKAASK